MQLGWILNYMLRNVAPLNDIGLFHINIVYLKYVVIIDCLTYKCIKLHLHVYTYFTLVYTYVISSLTLYRDDTSEDIFVHQVRINRPIAK